MKTFPKPERALMWERAGGRCERCSHRVPELGWHAHHRQKRRHGDHTAPNGMVLCAVCHERVHKHEKESQSLGFTVASWDDPQSTPLVIGGRLVDAVTRQTLEDVDDE